VNWTFEIDALTIEEPVGFADLIIRARRDPAWHGIFFEASASDLQFYGEAAAYLKEKKEGQGFAAEATFRAITDCDGTDEVLEGKLDFRKYREKCGTECFVIMPVEQEGCLMTMRNRYDQKVDLDNRIAFDGQTILPEYDYLNFTMEMAAQEMKARIEGYVVEGGEVVNLDVFPLGTGPDFRGKSYAVRPTYGRAISESIETSQLTPTVQAASDNGLNDSALSPILLLEGQNNCYDNEMTYEGRLKGSSVYCLDDDTPGSGGNASFDVKIQVVKGNDAPFGIVEVLHTVTVFDNTIAEGQMVLDFDLSYSGTTTLLEGQALFAYYILNTNSDTRFCSGALVPPSGYENTITFDEETYIIINSLKSCPPTDATVSMIHETASHITEAITDYCLTVKSDYYGRTDSEPYAAAEDGCGGLRVLTSGLRLRNADTPKHFLSLKDLFDSLNAIDNIGMAVEGDELRIEPVEYFYQDVKILEMPYIPDADHQAEEEMAYSLVKVGYKKWETENTNGLDEFNSNKEFRTTLKTIDNTLDITSNFIAGGYPIEHTRQQTFALTGAADTKYDNDTFIVVVERGYPNFIVEQGITENASDFFSPTTAYNWRIRPMYNLMRWWKSIAQSYVNLFNSASKLFFSAGTGNLLAAGNLAAYDACRVDANRKAENDDLGRNDIYVGQDPIWKPETVVYNYPMSLKDYNLVKANPYGYIYYQCGTGEFEKGYIIDLMYRPAKGTVEVRLKKKWE
jgi:hypothetical protein